jgi:nucleotide-binding universal stress UspA family protein
VTTSSTGGSIRNVLVHLDAAACAAARLRAARAVARRFGAELFAQLCIEPSLDSMRLVIAEAPAALFETRAAVALEQAQRWFEQRAAGDVAGTWLEPSGADPAEAFVRQARCADLVVMGTLEAAATVGSMVPSGLTEAVLLRSGRPLLLMPAQVQRWEADARVVVVGWNGTSHSARAVAAALPWMQAARHVHVLVSRHAGEASEADGLEIRGALARHGIDATTHRDPGDGPGDDAGRRLAGLADEVGAGLVVMGGYGHGRLQEQVWGGATATMLRAAPLPVRMVH